MLGGQPQKARFHFERAMELTEEQSAIVFVQMARFYAVQQFDRELYVSLLERALAIPADSAPELTLQNEAAHRQASPAAAGNRPYFLDVKAALEEKADPGPALSPTRAGGLAKSTSPRALRGGRPPLSGSIGGIGGRRLVPSCRSPGKSCENHTGH